MPKLEREWAGYDIAVVDAQGRTVAFLECKSTSPRELGRALFENPLPAVAEPTLRSEPEGKAIGFRAVFESYAAEAELAASTVKRWKGIIDRFVDTTTPGGLGGRTSSRGRTCCSRAGCRTSPCATSISRR